MKKISILLMCTICLFNAHNVSAQAGLTKSSPTYAQDFSSLGTATQLWTNNSTLANWYASSLVLNANGIVSGDGSLNVGNLYNYGVGTGADRAIGSLASLSTGDTYFGVRLKNNDTRPITSITVAFTGEQWRDATTTVNTLIASYQVSSTAFTDVISGTYTAASGWNFVSCQNTGTGNGSVQCSTAVSATIEISVPAGDEIMIRWHDADDLNDDQGLSMDDLTITASYDYVWTGTTNTVWATGSNWNTGSAPTTADNAVIPNVTNDPVLSSGTGVCDSILIESGAVVTVNGSGTLQIAGGISNSGTFDATAGTIELNGTSAQSIPANTFSTNTIKSLTLNNSAGASLGGTLNITDTYTPTSGTLTSNNNLVLISDASATARIAAGSSSGNYITGNVTLQRYIPGGKRAFRFFGHPFTTGMPLTALMDDVDITGTGGSANGFTTTQSNNPSAYWFDAVNADTAVIVGNSGWTAFTNTNGAGANSWSRYKMILLLVRGAKTFGLDGAAYTPLAVTLDASGTMNQGTQTITLTKGANSEFVDCSNPFPSGVQMQNVSKGSNVGANYYVWDATSGAIGAYITNPFSLSYVLPSFSALFTNIIANTNNTLTFEEADKASGGAALYKGTAQPNLVELIIADTATRWDRLLISMDDNSMAVHDKMDGKKLQNPGLDLFTISKDDVPLAVDVRPYDDGGSIPLGLTAYNRYNKYVIKTGMFDIAAGTKLYLRDNYLNKTEELKAGFEYWFDVTTDSLSQGNKRFVINMVGKPTTGIINTSEGNPQIQLIPNPANHQVKVSFDKLEGATQIRLVNVTGKMVYSQETNAVSGSVIIPLQNLPNGIYIVDIQSRNARFTEKLIKQ